MKQQSGGSLKRVMSSVSSKVMSVPFMRSKYALYAIFALAIIHAVNMITKRLYNNLIFFLLIGVLTHYFTRNMVLVIGLPLLVSYLATRSNMVREGLENADASAGSKDEKKDEKKEEKKDSAPSVEDAEKLAKHQKELMNQMKDMQPLLNQANSMMESMGGMEGMLNFVEKAGSIMGGLGGSVNKNNSAANAASV